MTTFTIAGVALRRLLRDRTALFFVVLLPVVVILVIGVTVASPDTARLTVVDLDHSSASRSLVHDLGSAPAFSTVTGSSVDGARTAVRRGERDVALVIPAGYGAALAAGRNAQVTTIDTAAPGNRQAADTAVSAVVAAQASAYQAARFAAGHSALDLTAALALARTLQQGPPAVGVRTDVVDSGSDILPAGFGYTAPTMLVLFVFVNALAGGAAMIQTRGLGLYGRIMAAPVRSSQVVLGEGLGFLMLSLLQSCFIVLIGWLVFGVSWGNPLAAGVLVVAWAMVGTGAGMLSGTVFRTPEQASAIGPFAGIALGMLGGCMWPLAVVTPVMQKVGHLAPQAWAVDAWTALLSRNGSLSDIVPQLAVLLGVAAFLIALASVRFHRRLVS
jgi:ABC-2 type transport system permease protein